MFIFTFLEENISTQHFTNCKGKVVYSGTQCTYIIILLQCWGTVLSCLKILVTLSLCPEPSYIHTDIVCYAHKMQKQGIAFSISNYGSDNNVGIKSTAL